MPECPSPHGYIHKTETSDFEQNRLTVNIKSDIFMAHRSILPKQHADFIGASHYNAIKLTLGGRMRATGRCVLLLALSLTLFGMTRPPVNPTKEEISVIPTPQSMEWIKDTAFAIPSGLQIVIEPSSMATDAVAVRELVQALDSRFQTRPVVSAGDAAPEHGMFITLTASGAGKRWLQEQHLTVTPEMQKEGYFLHITGEGVTVAAPEPAGLFYGIMSLIQLVEGAEKPELPAVRISDWPAMAFRGISDDISRGQVSTLEHFKKIIRFMARYKMNTYMPYLEDMFRFKKYPTIGQGRGALTAEEVRELQNFARDYFVDIIPIFQTLGHYENILNQPEFVHLADFPGAASLSPGKPEVYAFLQDLIDEIAPAFDSPYFHMGADESWDVGKGESRALVEKSDIATVHAQHYQKVADMLRKHGKKVMMYGDIILQEPTILNQLPRDIIVVDWHYGASVDYPSVRVFEQAGQPYIVSPGMSDWHRIFPDYFNAFLNIQNLTRQGFEHGALGSIISTWGDYGGVNFREWNWAGYAFAADCAWNPLAADVEGFQKIFFRQFYGTEPDMAETIYTLLAEMGGQVTYNEAWSHPFAPYRLQKRERLRKSLEMRLLAEEALHWCEQLEQQATRNREHIGYLKFSARMGKWIAEKQAFVLLWQQSMQEENIEGEWQKLQNAAVAQCRQLGERLEALKQEYQKLWLAYARPDNLELIMNLFDLQKQYWDIIAEEISQGQLLQDPTLPSEFIYFPKETDDAAVPEAYFRLDFPLKKSIKRALLQVINDGAVTAYVNGEKVGEAISRWALSLRVHQNMVRVFDVTRHLKKGDNVLAMEVHDFGDKADAGVNVYLHVEFKDGSTRVWLSDKYWQVSDRWFPDWQQVGFDDSAWFHARPRAKPVFISRPYFERGIPSRIDTR